MEILINTTAGGKQEQAWDDFLRKNLLGEFQQSGIWARYKSVTGWGMYRVVLRERGTIAAGFQLLWRRTRFGRIGYVSKGPVVAQDHGRLDRLAMDLLPEAGRNLRLAAMVVQPPGNEAAPRPVLPPSYFETSSFLRVASATLLLDLSRGMPEIESAMRRTTRQAIRKAEKNGIRIREGEENDVSCFFDLMLATCRRQKVSPNPSNADALARLFADSRRAGHPCRLTLAEYRGRSVAGLFCIPFGGTLTLWKKGSLPEFMDSNAMRLLYAEAIRWAQANGMAACDFGSINRATALNLLGGRGLVEEQRIGRDVFNLGFGGRPVLLPEAVIHFPNRFLARIHRIFSSRPGFSKRLYSFSPH